MSPRTRKTARKSTGPIGVPHHQLALRHEDSSSGSNDPTGPIGVPHHQLAPRHEDSSSGSNDPIGDLEAQVDQL
jgi:hypothetical protein